MLSKKEKEHCVTRAEQTFQHYLLRLNRKELENLSHPEDRLEMLAWLVADLLHLTQTPTKAQELIEKALIHYKAEQ